MGGKGGPPNKHSGRTARKCGTGELTNPITQQAKRLPVPKLFVEIIQAQGALKASQYNLLLPKCEYRLAPIFLNKDSIRHLPKRALAFLLCFYDYFARPTIRGSQGFFYPLVVWEAIVSFLLYATRKRPGRYGPKAYAQHTFLLGYFGNNPSPHPKNKS